MPPRGWRMPPLSVARRGALIAARARYARRYPDRSAFEAEQCFPFGTAPSRYLDPCLDLDRQSWEVRAAALEGHSEGWRDCLAFLRGFPELRETLTTLAKGTAPA